MVNRLRSKDALSGLLFTSVGFAGALLSRQLPVGDSVRMGPGYMPLAFSLILAALGLLIFGRAALGGAPGVEGWRARPVLWVLLAIVIFGLTIGRLGLVAATVLVIAASAFASPDSRRGETVLLALGLAAFSAILFVKLLGLPIELWPG